jgi:broad specificity phosphatase PhoE
MKPRNIFLVRHGESEGNVDPDAYASKPDYMLLLTSAGVSQASAVGHELASIMPSNEGVMFYISPLWRSRMTYEVIARHFEGRRTQLREDPRIREQEWGHLRDSAALSEIDEQRDSFGKFYYRIKDGESCADVFDRVSDFMNSLHRDFEKLDYPENVVLVTHGTTVRLFVMKWFHMLVEEFESLANPGNCDVLQLSLNAQSSKYTLTTELKRKEVPRQFMYEWGKV